MVGITDSMVQCRMGDVGFLSRGCGATARAGMAGVPRYSEDCESFRLTNGLSRAISDLRSVSASYRTAPARDQAEKGRSAETPQPRWIEGNSGHFRGVLDHRFFPSRLSGF